MVGMMRFMAAMLLLVFCSILGCEGPGSSDSGQEPTPPILSSMIFEEISAGDHHVCGRAPTGDVHCWGVNDDQSLPEFDPIRHDDWSFP